MADVSITVNKRDMRRVDLMLARFPKKGSIVLQRAINKTSDSARVQAVRDLAKNTKLKSKDLFKRGDKRRPVIQSRATNTKHESIIETTSRRIPISRFKARQLKKGVSYDLGRGRTNIKGSFIREFSGGRAVDPGDAGAGHEGVFIRKGDNRFPIKELFGPSILHVFAGASGILKAAIKTARKKLPKEIETQLNLVLEKTR